MSDCMCVGLCHVLSLYNIPEVTNEREDVGGRAVWV